MILYFIASATDKSNPDGDCSAVVPDFQIANIYVSYLKVINSNSAMEGLIFNKDTLK